MAIAAILIEGPADRRGGARGPIGRNDAGREAAAAPHRVVVHDLSSAGLRLETALDLASGATVDVGLPGVGPIAVRVLRREGAFYGCRFVEPVPAGLLEQALARSSAARASPGRTPPVALAEPPAALPEPDVGKWPPAVRIGLLLGSAAAAWWGILHLAS